MAAGKPSDVLALPDRGSADQEGDSGPPEVGCEMDAKPGDGMDDSPGEFIATHEWQDVRDGQAIPAGLHIRMNLSTGKKEAKLLA